MWTRRRVSGEPIRPWPGVVRAVAIAAGGVLLQLSGSASAASLDEIERQHREQIDAVADIVEKGIPVDDSNLLADLRRQLEAARSLKVKTDSGEFVFRSDVGDFYYAWVMCRTRTEPRAAEVGARIYRKMQQSGSLSEKRQAMVRTELQKCGKTGGASYAEAGSSTPVSYRVTARFLISAVQKGGRGGSQAIQFAGAPRLKPVEPGSATQSAAALAKLLGPGYRTLQAGAFVIASRKPESYLRALFDKVLDPYYSYLTKRLGIDERQGIFVAVTSDPHEAIYVGERFYGSPLIAESMMRDTVLAYTDPQARLMVAVCGTDPANCTSFAHELFHLLNGRVFEDAPWWLDEGMAELFESGDLLAGEFVPRVGWRKRDLNYDDLNAQGVTRLLSLAKNWAYSQSWPGPESELAKARFLTQYLHQKGQLWPLYEALRARSPDGHASDPSGLELVKTRVGPIESLASAFRAWALETVKPAQAAPGP